MVEGKGKKKGDGRMMNSRIPVTQDTLDRVRDFAKGLDATYDEAVNFLIDWVAKEKSRDPLLSGYDLRSEFEKSKGSPRE